MEMQLWKGFRQCQVSAFARIAQSFEYTRIWLNNALWQGSEYAWSTKYARAQNMARLWKCKGCTGCWICLNKLEYASMSQYSWISLNNAEHIPAYAWKNSSEYARILNVFDAVHSIRSLYKLLRCYRDGDIFKTLWNI